MANTTQDTILEAASQVFAEKGYDGARINELAEAAGVNKATLYYQIGDKEKLYHEVLFRILSGFADEIELSIKEVTDPVKRIRLFIDIFAFQTGTARYISPILLREIASGGRHLPDRAIEQMSRVVLIIRQIISDGVEMGVFRKVDPFFVHMLIVGSLNLYAANEPIRKRTSGITHNQNPTHNFDTPDDAAEKLFDLVFAAIRNPDKQRNS